MRHGLPTYHGQSNIYLQECPRFRSFSGLHVRTRWFRRCICFPIFPWIAHLEVPRRHRSVSVTWKTMASVPFAPVPPWSPTSSARSPSPVQPTPQSRVSWVRKGKLVPFLRFPSRVGRSLGVSDGSMGTSAGRRGRRDWTPHLGRSMLETRPERRSSARKEAHEPP
eukprot:scaffold524_cov357-Pavlova_lutheri.AAC.30